MQGRLAIWRADEREEYKDPAESLVEAVGDEGQCTLVESDLFSQRVRTYSRGATAGPGRGAALPTLRAVEQRALGATTAVWTRSGERRSSSHSSVSPARAFGLGCSAALAATGQTEQVNVISKSLVPHEGEHGRTTFKSNQRCSHLRRRATSLGRSIRVCSNPQKLSWQERLR